MKNRLILLGIVSLIAVFSAPAAELPSNFPKDVRWSTDMKLMEVSEVKPGHFYVIVHAPDKPLGEVAEWFQTEMVKDGWQASRAHIDETRAVMPFKKDGRSCGITVANFILDKAARRDDSTRGITILIDGPAESSDGVEAQAVTSADEGG